MAGNRLNDLLKQRALLEEHLAWLESEIQGEQCNELPGETKTESMPANRLGVVEETLVLAIEPPKEVIPPDQQNVVPDVYDELGPDTRGSASDAKKGCIGIFAASFVVLALFVVWVIYAY